ncbi:hypothetical protein C0993_006263 [Termitomyces sp. T159_Od127]|nr:hypothetical protein C0993_006263 [Termitomyces sp. T159_Od127]
MMTLSAPDATAANRRVAHMVFQAIQAQLTAQLQASLDGIHKSLEGVYQRLTRLEQVALEPRAAGHIPKINPPEVYDGKSKQLADQFTHQVEAAAEFELFRDDRQKIVWAQSYLSGLAQEWLYVITTGSGDPDLNPRRFQWDAWLADFWATFCTRVKIHHRLLEEVEIERILRERRTRGGVAEFLVRWKGYDDSEDEWLKEYDMPHALEAIQEFRANEQARGKGRRRKKKA